MIENIAINILNSDKSFSKDYSLNKDSFSIPIELKNNSPIKYHCNICTVNLKNNVKDFTDFSDDLNKICNKSLASEIEQQKKEIKEKFWDMFVIDSLIGNTDRHNGNWGFLLNKQINEITFSPIYDCGSCLNPLLEDTELENMNSAEIKNLAINCYSCIKLNGKKINYMSFMQKMKNKECNDAIKRRFKKVNINEINYYITICEKQNLSVRQLREHIKNKEYERLDKNTKLKLIKKEKLEVQDAIKNPIIICNKSNYEIVSEKVLQKLILEDIPAFLDELGNGFTFGRK